MQSDAYQSLPWVFLYPRLWCFLLVGRLVSWRSFAKRDLRNFWREGKKRGKLSKLTTASHKQMPFLWKSSFQTCLQTNRLQRLNTMTGPLDRLEGTNPMPFLPLVWLCWNIWVSDSGEVSCLAGIFFNDMTLFDIFVGWKVSFEAVLVIYCKYLQKEPFFLLVGDFCLLGVGHGIFQGLWDFISDDTKHHDSYFLFLSDDTSCSCYSWWISLERLACCSCMVIKRVLWSTDCMVLVREHLPLILQHLVLEVQRQQLG